MRAPAVLLAIPFLIGAAASVHSADRLDSTFPFVAGAVAMMCWLAAVGGALQSDDLQSVSAVLLGMLAAGMSLGASSAKSAYEPLILTWFEAAQPAEPVILEGMLREDAAPTLTGLSLALDVTSIDGRVPRVGGGAPSRSRSLGGVRLTVGGALGQGRAADWRAGRSIRVPAFVRRPSTYLNPGTPDERRPLARRGVVLVGSVKSAALVEVTRRGTITSESAAAIRAAVRDRIARHLTPLSATSAGVATAVLIGDRSGLTPEEERRLQEAGTYHVIAISGGNIAVLAVLALLICRFAFVPSRVAAVLTAAGLVFYGAVCGAAPSVTRAVTVAVLVLSARALDHRGAALNALAIAALAGVAVSPVIVLDAGFILSFGATLGILLGTPLFVRLGTARPRNDRMPRSARITRTVAALGVATICAEVALVPVAASLFGRVPLAGLVLNFAAIPLMTAVQIMGLAIAVTSSWWNHGAGFAAAAAHLAASGLLRSARLVQFAPWLTLDVAPPAGWLIALYYAAALALIAPRVRVRAAVSLGALAAVMLCGSPIAAREAVSRAGWPVRIVMLDVGQGDATVALLPDGKALLVDAGGVASFASPDPSEAPPTFDVGERVVAPALRALRVRDVEALVVSHGDPDHLMGATGILRHVRARSVWEGVPVPRHAGLQALTSIARRQAMTWRTVQAGDVERVGDAEVRVLHPPPPEWERQRVRNEDSVVLEIRIGRVSVVLPGDIGTEGERLLLPRIERGRLVILKAPHHGSATSSTQPFLDALRPSAVLFSCGRDNRFGHPHPAVVARYEAMDAEIFSTAQDGAVFVDTDGTTAEVWGWRGKRAKFAGPRP